MLDRVDATAKSLYKRRATISRGGSMTRMRFIVVLSLVIAGVALPRISASLAQQPASPIEHVVILFQENHAFDDVLGYLCEEDLEGHDPCDGARTGKLLNGDTIPLVEAGDIVAPMAHGVPSQIDAVNGGLMNGWERIKFCQASNDYACYRQYHTPKVGGSDGFIANLSDLAKTFVISDRTFQDGYAATWAAHMTLAAATFNGFNGAQPKTVPGNPDGKGWGCDSYLDAPWRARPGDRYIKVPSCIPAPDGSGPYRPSPVQWVPTIMNRMDDAGLSWRIYGAPEFGAGGVYATTICPTFAECLNGPQHNNVVPQPQIYDDATAGNLPKLSIVMPEFDLSQHNQRSMLLGDNYLGRVVSDIMNGPDWNSTAIFITYDDCGCFYDHVPPPPGRGLRVPMVIISPYAKPGFTDSNVASFASMLAFTESTFGLQPLTELDANAYDYAQSFDFTQQPLPPIPLKQRPLPLWEIRWLREHPGPVWGHGGSADAESVEQVGSDETT